MKLSPEKQINSTKENISKILKNWNITDFNMKKLNGGIENTSLKIKTSSGDFVLRIYRQKHKTREAIQEELEFMNFLALRNIPIPEVYKNNINNFESINEIDGKNWFSMLMKFIPGEHIEKYNEKIVRELGRIMAEFHLASLDYILKTGKNYKVKKYENKFLDKIKIEAIQDVKNKEFFVRLKKFKYNPPKLPAAIIHGDLTPDNFLCSNGRVISLLDFDDMHYGYVICDIAVTGRSILAYGNADLLKIFLSAYEKIRKISQKEKGEFKNFMQLSNYFIGPVVVHLFGEKSVQMDTVLEIEKKINEFKIN